MNKSPSFPRWETSRVSVSPELGEDPQPSSGIFGGAAFTFWLAGIFILYTRFFDLALNGYYIPRIVLSFMLLFFLLSGRAFVFLQSVLGKTVFLLVGWAGVAVVFSVWKGGSVPQYYTLLMSFSLFAIACGLPTTFANVRLTTYVLACAGVVAALMSIPWGGTFGIGRLSLAEGSYRDPNYYSLALFAIVPFMGAFVVLAKSFVVKIPVSLGILAMLLVISKKG
jgi:hypothetical protein